MHFNKAELAALVTNPTIEFDKEGILGITERQEGFLRTSDVNFPRWCKLRGNLLFYLKDQYLFSPPAGLLVLENCRPIIHNNGREIDGFAFFLEFENPMTYPIRICANTAKDRGEWVKYIQLASYVHLNRQIDYLQKQILNAMGNRIETGVIITDTIQTPSDAGVPNEYLTTNSMSNNSSNNQIAEGDLIQF